MSIWHRRHVFGRVWPVAGLCLTLVLASPSGLPKTEPHMPTLVRLAESTPGPAAAEQTCTIVYLDSKYHSERISHKTGKPPTADVYEGVLSVADFNRLMKALQTKRFLKLKPPPRQKPSQGPAAEAELLQIMVPRNDGVQDLNYPTLASRKRAEKALKPVLEWWKDHRSNLPPPVKHGVSHLCNPASSSAK